MTTQTQAVSTLQATEGEFQTGQVMTIAGGHFLHDTFSAFVSPLLPLIIEKLSLSLTLAGALPAISQLPSLLNPFIGYLADKVSVRYFVILAPAATATLMSCLGFAPSYFTLVVMLLVAGISVAAFHAPAPVMVARVSSDQVGKGMSLFMAGGELGRTVGPLLVVWAVSVWGLEGYYRVMVIGWATSLILYLRLRNISARPTRQTGLRTALPAFRRLFVPLLVIIFMRSFQATALSVFLPTFMSMEGAEFHVAGASLSVLELAGVVGALISGTLSDRLGRKTILLATMGSAAVMMVIFLNVGGWLLVPVLLGLGFTTISTQPVLLAVVQEHLPNHRATANGLFMAMSFSLRLVAVLIIGAVGDRLGLRPAFLGCAFATLLALPAVFWLPGGTGEEGER